MDESSFRTVLIATLLVPQIAALASSLWFGERLREFAARHKAIETQDDLLAYKRLVAGQMYAALIQIVLLASPPFIFIVGTMVREISTSDLGFILLPSCFVFFVSMRYKALESRIQNLPTGTSDIRQERDHVNEVWVSKPFPDW